MNNEDGPSMWDWQYYASRLLDLLKEALWAMRRSAAARCLAADMVTVNEARALAGLLPLAEEQQARAAAMLQWYLSTGRHIPLIAYADLGGGKK